MNKIIEIERELKKLIELEKEFNDTSKDFQKKLVVVANGSGVRSDYIAKKLGMKPQNYSQKKKLLNFTYKEMNLIISILQAVDKI